MSFDWREFLTLAEELYTHPDQYCSAEASFRSATSRAYYAAFQCAYEFACEEGFEPVYGESSHSYLQRHFSHHPLSNPIYRKISVQLNRLRALRVQADYAAALKGSPQFMANSAIGMAKIVLDCLRQLRG